MMNIYINKCIEEYKKKYMNFDKIECDKQEDFIIEKNHILNLIESLNERKLFNSLHIFKKIKNKFNLMNFFISFNNLNDFIDKKNFKINLIKLNFLVEKKERFWLEMFKNIIRSYKYDK